MPSLFFAIHAFMRRIPRDLAIALIVCAAGAIGLFLDSDASLLLQNALGVAAWCILLALLKGEASHVRIQVVVVMIVATACEYYFAPNWHIYIYRFDNVPAYVSPAHGMIYLAAAALSRSELFLRHHRSMTGLALLSGTAWAAWGAFWAERGDVGGAALFAILFVFILFGRSSLLYVAAFFITTYLELVGTHYGTWAWASHMPVFGLSQANPPSGIAAGYCVFDAAAVAGAAMIEKARDSLFIRRRFDILTASLFAKPCEQNESAND